MNVHRAYSNLTSIIYTIIATECLVKCQILFVRFYGYEAHVVGFAETLRVTPAPLFLFIKFYVVLN